MSMIKKQPEKLILIDPIPKLVKEQERAENDKKWKRKWLIFLAKKMHAASNGGTFLTGCNIADEFEEIQK